MKINIWQNPTLIHDFLKSQQKLRIEKNFLKSIKKIHKQPIIAIITLNGEKPETFPLRLETGQGCPLPALLFNIIPEVLANAVRQEKEI